MSFEIPYAELHCRSNFSFLRAASHPDELVRRSHELGYSALALTDLASVAGVVRGHGSAKECGLKYIVGTEVHCNDAPPLVLWPTDRAAYGRLCRLISRARLRSEKGHYELMFDDVAEHATGMIAGAYFHSDGDADLAIAPNNVTDNGSRSNKKDSFNVDSFNVESFLSGKFQDVFEGDGYLLAHCHHGVDDRRHLSNLAEISRATAIPLVAAGNVRYHEPDRSAVFDCVTAIRNGCTIDKVHEQRLANSSYHLRSLSEINLLYQDYPEAIRRTTAIAERCRFSLDDLRYEYPEEMSPHGMTLIEHLRRLTWEGAKQRWPEGVPTRVVEILRHEMEIIRELRYEAYFLTVWDMVRFAKERGILCQGRGSAANSTVCYCLGITNVDPSQTDLLFERFVSRERDEAPDIDVDFEHQRREEVLQYLYDKYGRDRAGMTAVVTTYRTRSAIREVGKALGVSPDVIDAIAKLGGSADGYEFPDRCAAGGLDPESELGHQFVTIVSELIGFPRHLSQHTGGMVMAAGHLCELCPIENASMPERTVIQWNKDDLEELGILKVDVLALGMLSALRRCFDLVRDHYGQHLSLSRMPQGDKATYDMICRAETMGVFQIESRAQMSMLPRLRPRCYYDLVIEVAIVRPGPIQGDMVHPYLKARDNPQSVEYPNDEIREVLKKTLGVPIFQEQAMRLAVVAAGFTPGEADQLRRAMAAWRRKGVIEKFRLKLLEGMKQKGLTGKFADQVFNQIRGFGEYGFPESHAASFALLVYASCYLKCHYPAAFCAALLNSQPMGFYAPAQLVADAKKNGVDVLPADVNFSDWDATLQTLPTNPEPSLRLGLRAIKGLKVATAERIEQERKQTGTFKSISQLASRCRLGRSELAILADADAFASMSGDRRAAVWESLDREKDAGIRPLIDDLGIDEALPNAIVPMSEADEVHTDYETTGLSLRNHPLAFVRQELDELGCLRASDLPSTRSGRQIRVAGMVLLRQRPGTAKGITFVTIEDETGAMNLVIHLDTWKRHYKIARTTGCWLIAGRLEKRDEVIHIIVGKIESLGERLGREDLMETRSRDFR